MVRTSEFIKENPNKSAEERHQRKKQEQCTEDRIQLVLDGNGKDSLFSVSVPAVVPKLVLSPFVAELYEPLNADEHQIFAP